MRSSANTWYTSIVACVGAAEGLGARRKPALIPRGMAVVRRVAGVGGLVYVFHTARRQRFCRESVRCV